MHSAIPKTLPCSQVIDFMVDDIPVAIKNRLGSSSFYAIHKIRACYFYKTRA